MKRIILLLAVLAACDTPVEPSPDASVEESPSCLAAQMHSDLGWIQDNIFTPSCTFSGCHAGGNGAGDGLVLVTGSSRANLVNQPSKQDSGMLLVTPGDPAQSYLLVALGGASGPKPADGFMPLDSGSLCPDKVMAVQRWIAAGAMP